MMCGEGCRGAIHCALVACIVSPCGRNELRPYMRTLSSHEIVSVKHRSRKNPMHTREDESNLDVLLWKRYG